MSRYLYDSNRVRYELAKSRPGEPFNWLFLPGGPGADSQYLRSLIELLELPGNAWLIDLPGNGTNLDDTSRDFDFDAWFTIFPSVMRQFDNPILVGHSFGGMIPLLFPELEDRLKGIAILNSTPSLWLKEAIAYAQQFDLPDLSKEMHEFSTNPNQETFDQALNACTPYYFPASSLEQGRALMKKLPFRFEPAVWWQRWTVERNFSAKWVPQDIPTVIIGGKYDCICPFSLFQNDIRFKRDNITLYFSQKGGHIGWMEDPEIYQDAFTQLLGKIGERQSEPALT